MIAPPTQQPQINPSSSSNILKRLFYKYTDLDEQRFSEKMQLALKITDIFFRTKQCTRTTHKNVKDLVRYTSQNLDKSVYELDMMVNSNTTLNDVKHTSFVMYEYLDTETREEKRRVEFKQGEIQEILFLTLHKIDVELNAMMLEANLLDYWE